MCVLLLKNKTASLLSLDQLETFQTWTSQAWASKVWPTSKLSKSQVPIASVNDVSMISHIFHYFPTKLYIFDGFYDGFYMILHDFDEFWWRLIAVGHGGSWQIIAASSWSLFPIAVAVASAGPALASSASSLRWRKDLRSWLDASNLWSTCMVQHVTILW